MWVVAMVEPHIVVAFGFPKVSSYNPHLLGYQAERFATDPVTQPSVMHHSY